MTNNEDTTPRGEDPDEPVSCPKCGETLVRPFEEPSHESFFLVYARAHEEDIEVKLERGIAVLPLLCPECGRMEMYNNPAFGPEDSSAP